MTNERVKTHVIQAVPANPVLLLASGTQPENVSLATHHHCERIRGFKVFHSWLRDSLSPGAPACLLGLNSSALLCTLDVALRMIATTFLSQCTWNRICSSTTPFLALRPFAGRARREQNAQGEPRQDKGADVASFECRDVHV